MEITKLNMISDFVSPRVPQVYNSLWKWGALILALIATFTSVFTRIKLLIIRVRSIKRSSSKQLLQCFDDDFDFSDDDDDTSSTTSELDGEDTDDSSSYDGQTQNEFGDSRSELRRRRSSCDLFSWSDFTAGKSVVKLWDSLGLGFDFEDSSESEVSIWDIDRYQNISEFFAGKTQYPALTKSSPAVVYLAEKSENDRFVLGAYDRRISNDFPAVCAEWGPQRGDVVGVSSGGVEKVYVKGGGRAGGGELTMGDMRNVRSPLNNLTQSDAEIWWDAADAVMVNQEI